MPQPIEMNLAVTALSSHVPNEGTLEDRLRAAFRYARQHPDELFWMSLADDDALFKAACATVMVKGSQEDIDIITRSVRPLAMLAAAFSGVPVDWSAMPQTQGDLIPLMKWWQECGR